MMKNLFKKITAWFSRGNNAEPAAATIDKWTHCPKCDQEIDVETTEQAFPEHPSTKLITITAHCQHCKHTVVRSSTTGNCS